MGLLQFLKNTKFAAALDRRLQKLVALQLTKQRLDDLAYNSSAQGVNAVPVNGENVIVSLTTHGKRILSVHRTIESIFSQSILINKVVLYIGTEEFQSVDQLPVVLQRQMNRGLDIRFVKDIGPYTKLLYALKDFPSSSIITVDDDILYPANVVERLLMSHRQNKNAICGLAVRQLELKKGREFKPYKHLEFVVTQEDSTSNMYVAEGFGGVLYPPHCFSEEVFNEPLFRKLAPKADDLWFWANAIMNGTPILSVRCYQPLVRELLIDEDVQDIGLINDNFYGKGNDRQLKAICDHYNLYDRLR